MCDELAQCLLVGYVSMTYCQCKIKETLITKLRTLYMSCLTFGGASYFFLRTSASAKPPVSVLKRSGLYSINQAHYTHPQG